MTEPDPAVREWAAAEAVRRFALDPERRCRTVLAAFPRSGTHLVRWYCESAFGWSTLGSEDGEWLPIPPQLHDTPVHLRGLVTRPCSPEVVLVKRHGIRDLEQFNAMVLLRRDPVEAILSHRRDSDDEQFAATVERDVRAHVLLDRVYRQFDGPRMQLDFTVFGQRPEHLARLVDWLREVDPRLPSPMAVPLENGRAPMVARRPPGSVPGDRDGYAASQRDRAALVQEALARLS